MPELPEVEVVRRSLDSLVCGLKIINVDILNNKLRYKIPKTIKSALKNRKIISVRRRAKYLLIDTEDNNTLLIHLGMTGKIFILNKRKKLTIKTSFYYNSKILHKHDHIKIILGKYVELIYNDVRKFGFIKLLKTNLSKNNSNLSNLGPEPLSMNFNFKYLKTSCLKSKKNIKNFLMDQKYIAGLGNIYVNEILFKSSINPKKMTCSLKILEIKNIVKNTKIILYDSIKKGGSSIKDFNDISGKKGNFQQSFMVYDRESKDCMKKTCRSKIKKIYISNRSTFFCKNCQK
tara:strand:- start:5143 stop:6009 length:867 start_codon:yes stop_codon:yes gene_type:complete